jgi:hypothetical protein
MGVDYHEGYMLYGINVLLAHDLHVGSAERFGYVLEGITEYQGEKLFYVHGHACVHQNLPLTHEPGISLTAPPRIC